MSTFISNLQNRRSKYTHPDQATTQEQSLIQLSRGIYTEEERFVFELLQNAVDAYTKTDGCLHIQLLLQKGYLVFMHNGDAFSERDIEGLCDVGNGNKMTDTKKIGYKGIGFKSVFMRSTCVTVESGGYCFKFEKKVWDNYWEEHWDYASYGEKNPDKNYEMPWQIIPIEAQAPIRIVKNGFNVVTYIEIDREDQLAAKIEKLMASSQFLLFLRTKDIEMSFKRNGEIIKQIAKNTEDDAVTLSSNGKIDSKWLIYTNEEVEVPAEVKCSIAEDINTPQKLKEVKTFDLSFAVAIEKRGKLRKLEEKEAVMYTYLPTSFKFGDSGFPFLVNANFITDAGRQQLHKDSEWNKLIFSKLPSEYLNWMKQISSKYENYYEVLPLLSYGSSDELQKAYADNMAKAVDTIAFIPTEKNKENTILAKNAVMDRMGIRDCLPIEKFIIHLNNTYSLNATSNSLIKNVWKGIKILQEYGVFIFDKKKIPALFADETVFDDISIEYDSKLIDYLYNYSKNNPQEDNELFPILKDTRLKFPT